MRQFAEQVRQVGIVYRTYRGTWGWVGAWLFFTVLWVISLEFGRRSNDDGLGSGWMFFALCNTSFAAVVYAQVRQQFIHPRAKLLPNFSVPHWIVPLAILIFAGFIVPTLLALFTDAPIVPMCAIASAVFAVSLLLTAHPNSYWMLFIAFFGAQYFGYNIFEWKFQEHPIACALILVATWVGILAAGYRVSTLCEDDEAYQRVVDATRRVQADGPDGQTQSQFQNFARWSAISDRWHARIGGFHQGRTVRIVRLLRYGFGATPVELTAIASSIVMTLFVGRIIPITDDSYYLTRSTDFSFLIVPALFASIAPIVVAGGAIGLRVPRLKNEALFPLTRRALIDNLLLTSAWHSLLCWLLGCASGTGILMYALPAEAKTVSLFATAAMLTAAVAVAAYGLSLHLVMWEKFGQFFMFGLFVLGVVFLMCAWWSSREEMGDAPYWVVAAIVMGVGAMMTHAGRTVWLNQEFG